MSLIHAISTNVGQASRPFSRVGFFVPPPPTEVGGYPCELG